MPPDPSAARRRLPIAETVLAALLLVAALGPLAWDFYRAHGLFVPGRVMVGRDFVNCWAGAHLVVTGQVASIYSPDYMAAVRALLGLPLGNHNFSYPPPLLLIVWPLGFLPYGPALLLWLGSTGAFYAAAARSWLQRAGLPWWSALLVPAVWINAWAGHHGFVLAGLWLFAFALLGKRPAAAGLLIALLALKPHMGVLIPLVLLLRRQWTAIGVAAAATLALVLAAGLVVGWGAWSDYFTWTAKLQTDMLLRDKPAFFDFMPTAYVGAWLATRDFAFALAAQLALGAAAVTLVVRSALSRMDWTELGLVTATATFLVLPYAFNYDMTVVGLAALLLLFRRGERLHWAGRAVALLALGAPILVIGASYLRLPAIPLVLLAFLWVQVRAYAPRMADRTLSVALASQ